MGPATAPRKAVGRNPQSLFFRALPAGWETDRKAFAGAQRERLLEAMSRAVATRGYVNVTVADVVALAGVSRTTFYENFADKEACFLETYAEGSRALVEGIAVAIRGSGQTDWHDRVRTGIEQYLELLGSNPYLARAILVDVLGAGPAAVELRRKVFSSFVDLFRPSPHGSRPADVAMRRVPEPYLRGLVGGIAELVQEQIVARGAESLPDLGDTLVGLAFSIVELGTRQSDRDSQASEIASSEGSAV
jgi:AcrR family transcriptional regulator